MNEKINLNKATAIELQKIIHIGPKRANDIIVYRTTVKKFSDRYEITNVPNIGPKRMADIIAQNIVTA